MTLSVWRYAHLALALCASVFLIVASITGAILAVDAIGEKLPPYKISRFDSLSLAESLPVLKKSFEEVSEISVDHNQFVTLEGFDIDLNEVKAVVDPSTGRVLGTPQKKSAFIEWVTALHRSLFLHETGRVMVGIVSFLLLMIAASGIALILQRQKGFKRFFGKITKDGFAQFYHIVFGRLALVPILVIAFTGTFLTMERFHLFGEQQISHKIGEISSVKKIPISDFPIFKTTTWAGVKSIQFPFTDDPEEYFLLKLHDRELAINQQNGAILSEIPYSQSSIWTEISLALHTGRIGIVWAVVLLLACGSILFFIWSGFAMTLKRRSVRIKNRIKSKDAKFILLAGSENGGTLRFADAIHKQLLNLGLDSFLAQPNDYKQFPNAEHLILFTSTHGLGDAPSNADKLQSLLEKFPQNQKIKISVVGFGSMAYPDFCGFAKKSSVWFMQQSWAEIFLPVHTVNDKSASEFVSWVKSWSSKSGIDLATTPALYNQKPGKLSSFRLTEKIDDGHHTILLTLKSKKNRFQSGDLLAIYPNNNATERLYSIGKVKGKIQLAVKLHENGLGSGFWNSLEIGSEFRARIVSNLQFHLQNDSPIAMIANGTGIAPFLGMLEASKTRITVYAGFRQRTSLTDQYQAMATQAGHTIHLAFSRQDEKFYVTDLVKRDVAFFAELLASGGRIMICGSLLMQKDVEETLDKICREELGRSLVDFKANGQLLTDCY